VLFYYIGERKDSFRATVQWYWWMIELPRLLQRNATSHKEVFLNRKNYANEIDVETILKIHKVSYVYIVSNNLSNSQLHNNSTTYKQS